MKQFLKLITLFFCLLFATIFVMNESVEWLVSKNADFKLESEPSYIILGHSHPATAFNDSLIPQFNNLAQAGESLYYTYFKSKKILADNPSIDVVFIEFTNNHIEATIDNWIWEDKYINFRYPIYAPFIPLEDKVWLAKQNPSSFSNASSLSFNRNSKRIVKENYNYAETLGGYVHLDRNFSDSSLYQITNQKKEFKQKELSDYSITYLKKIIAYCEQEEKKVVLVRSPFHPKFEGFNNEKTYQEIRKQHFNNNIYLDFSAFPLEDSEYGDFQHLNYKGANVFSVWFAKLIENGLLEKENKQKFIEENFKTN